MNKQNFLADFETFVVNKIKSDFLINSYFEFSLDFQTLLNNYFKTFIENQFLIDELTKKMNILLFEEHNDIISRLERINTEYYNVSRKFDSLIYEIDEQNLWTLETLTMIVNKLNLCKQTI